MGEDPIVREIQKVRDKIAKRHGNDLQAICDDARKKQGRDGRKVVRMAPKTVSGKPPGESAA
jgi:hypothetical protein